MIAVSQGSADAASSSENQTKEGDHEDAGSYISHYRIHADMQLRGRL